MINTIRLEETFSEDTCIEDKLILLMELSEEMLLKSLAMRDVALSLKMKLEGDA